MAARRLRNDHEAIHHRVGRHCPRRIPCGPVPVVTDPGHALVASAPSALAPASRLAARTLAERAERRRTLTVGSGGYGTITEAVDAARDGDTVVIMPGRYEETVIIEGKSITVRGDGEPGTVVVGLDEHPAFILLGTATTLRRLTIGGGGPHERAGDHAGGTAIRGALFVIGGRPTLDDIHLTGPGAVVFEARAGGWFRHSHLEGTDSSGLEVMGGASPTIEDNDLRDVGMFISGPDTRPLVRANRVQGGQIWVCGGASPTLDGNEIWDHLTADVFETGITIEGLGSDPLVRGNRVHGCAFGLFVLWEAHPHIVDNEIWANATAGITVAFRASPVIRANRVRAGEWGVLVEHGSSPLIEANDIEQATQCAISVRDGGSAPTINGNHMHDTPVGILVERFALPVIGLNEYRNVAVAVSWEARGPTSISHDVATEAL